MRISDASSRTLTVSVALAMLAGCSDGSSQVSPTTAGQNTGAAATQSVYQAVFQGGRFNALMALRQGSPTGRRVATPSSFSPNATGKPLIFVSDENTNVVNIFLQARKNKMVGQITALNEPNVLATDAAGNLYITNENGANVPIFAPPYTGAPKLTLDDTGYFPFGVAVSPRGVVGVANVCTAPSCPLSSANVTLYAKNSTTPCATVADPAAFRYIYNDAFDDKGNLYIVGDNTSNASVIGEVTGGCKAKAIMLLTTGNPISLAGAIHVDRADRIAILQGESGQQTIDAYNAPQMGSLGYPVVTCHLTPLNGYPNAIVDFAFRTTGHDLYALAANGGNSYVVAKYDYPAGGAHKKLLAAPSFSEGLAVTPPLLP